MDEIMKFLRDYPGDLRCFVFTLVKHLLSLGKTVKYSDCLYGLWCEIDTLEDLKLYKDIIPEILKLI
jgi:hypothetical protein